MEVLKDRYTITELSERLGLTDHALRYYEKEFNMIVPKDDRGRRYYTTDLANVMYQIKTMRSDGLEIKAIKKILQSENMIGDPLPVVMDNDSVAMVPAQVNPVLGITNEVKEIKQVLEDFKGQLTACVTAEVASSREFILREMNKTKLELGACVENGFRRMETKLEKHFEEVDQSLGRWREKNKKGPIKRLFIQVFK